MKQHRKELDILLQVFRGKEHVLGIFSKEKLYKLLDLILTPLPKLGSCAIAAILLGLCCKNEVASRFTKSTKRKD